MFLSYACSVLYFSPICLCNFYDLNTNFIFQIFIQLIDIFVSSVDLHPVLKADSIKYVIIFRNMVSLLINVKWLYLSNCYVCLNVWIPSVIPENIYTSPHGRDFFLQLCLTPLEISYGTTHPKENSILTMGGVLKFSGTSL